MNPASNLPEDEFLRMANDWLEGDLSPEDRERLHEVLTNYPDRRRAFAELCSFDTEVRSLMEAKALPKTESVAYPASTSRRNLWLGTAAAAVIALLSLLALKLGTGMKQHPVALSSSWNLQATPDTDYQVLAIDRIRLNRGELRLRSSSSSTTALTIETPLAQAQAKGTEFLIGHVAPKHATDMKSQNKTKLFTRLLVLSGTVSLTSQLGTVTAAENEAAIAEKDKAPEIISMKSNSSFAVRCYTQLAKTNQDKNLFFSPYSISNALLMAAEGARGETAAEMGEVLGFPESLRRTGDNDQHIPWEMGTIHTGQARLNKMLTGESLDPEQQKLREKEAVLAKKWASINAKMEKYAKAHNQKIEYDGSPYLEEQHQLAEELNEVRRNISVVTIRVANGIWGEQSIPFEKPWEQTVRTTYGTGAVQAADFIGNHETERKRINTWVENQTEGRIQNLIDKGSLSNLTRLVLANAIYFKGDWATPFNSKWTENKKFQRSDGTTNEVPMIKKYEDETASYAAFNGDGTLFATPKVIRSNEKLPQTYPKADGFAMLQMPYRGGDFAMVILAPNDPAGLASLEAKLSEQTLTKWIASLKKRKTDIMIPKFKSDTGLNMNDTLKAMGMPSAFTLGTADFSGITKETKDGFYISDVIHKASISVNEKGTEAVAATEIDMGFGAAESVYPFIPVFTLTAVLST